MLRIQPYRPYDAQTILPWIGDEKAFYFWSADRYDRYPITPQDVNALYIREEAQGPFYPMSVYDGKNMVAHFILRCPAAEKPEELRLGFVILDPDYRGQGFGKEFVRQAVEYAFASMGAKRITLGVFRENEAAYGCYRACGFAETGAVRECRCMGETWQSVEMEIAR